MATALRQSRRPPKARSPSETRAAIEKTFAEFKPDRRFREANEARTRLEVINAILGALGWGTIDIEVEVHSGTGDYLDYELYAQDQPWMVLEAKRAGQTFDLSDATKENSSNLRSIASLQSQGGSALREALKQAATYCNDRGIPLACVTNGFQWLFFRGLSTKKRTWVAGSALVFSGAPEIIGRFDDFARALGRDWAGTSYLYELLEKPVATALPGPVIPSDFLNTRRKNPEPERIAILRSVSEYLLGDIYGEGRKDMLDRCYVTPGISGDFVHSIERLLKDEPVGFDDESANVTGGTPETFVTSISKQSQLSSIKHPVVVVGHVGVGKTTFLQRSLSKFRDDKSAFCALADLEGHGQGTAIDAVRDEAHVAELLIDKLATATRTVLNHHGSSAAEMQQVDPHDPGTLRTLLRERIEQERAVGEKVWRADPAAWDKKEYEMFSAFRADSKSMLTRYLRHLRGRFKAYPVLLVLDNLDQASENYQRCIYGFAQRLARDTTAVIVLCLREDTFKAGREEDGFLSSSPLPFVFHVARPPLDRLLRQRTTFGDFAVDKGLLPRGLRSEPTAVKEVCELLRATMLPQKSEALNMFAALAGHNMREALSLVRGLVDGSAAATAKPDPSAAYAFECLLVSQGHTGLKTLCRVANCFDAEASEPPFHTLRLRLLAYFAFAFDAVADRAYLEIAETAVGRFASWGYPVALIRKAVLHLLDYGLLAGIGGEHPMDGHSLPKRIRLTASGYVHLTQLAPLPAYRAASACYTRWYDKEMALSFVEQATQAGSESGVTMGDIMVSPALGYFESYLAASLTREDERLSLALQKQSWVADVRARAATFCSVSRNKSDPPSGKKPTPSSASRANRSQLPLPLAAPGAQALGVSELPTIRSDREYKDTVWIPRILWALEWASRHGLGPQSPSDMARILKSHGELDVPPNNVARAFREFRGKPDIQALFRCSSKRYEISEAGRLLLKTLIEEDQLAPVSSATVTSADKDAGLSESG